MQGSGSHRCRPLAGFPFAHQVANDDQTRRNADASGKGGAPAVLQTRNRLESTRSPGANSALCLIFMGPRPTKIREHAIAKEFGDVTLEARDLAHHRVLIELNELTHLLRVEPGCELGRADEIDEHHRELPPFGLGRRRQRLVGPPVVERW